MSDKEKNESNRLWYEEVPDDIKEIMAERFDRRKKNYDNVEMMDKDQRKAMSRQLMMSSKFPDNPFARRFDKPKHLLVKVFAYFDESKDMGRPFTWSGLATHLGCEKSLLSKYARGEKGETAEDREHFKQILEMAQQTIEASKEEMGLLGKYNSAFALADLKFNHGWKDVQTVDSISSDGSARITKRIVDPQDPQPSDEEDESEPGEE